MKRILFVLGISLCIGGLVNAGPERSKGLSLHLLPQSVAEANQEKWGFVVSDVFCQRHQKTKEAFQSFAEILLYFRTLSRESQKDGIWIVITHPEAFSDTDKQVFESVRQGCLKEKITLFVCQGSKLPDGWIDGGAFSLEQSDTLYLAKEIFDRGWKSFKQGDLDAALKSFNRAINIDPGFAPGYFSRAYIYSVQNKPDLAAESYRKTAERYPQYSHFYSNLGMDLLHSKKLNEAFAMLNKIVEIDPANGDAHLNMACYYFEIGDYSNCWKHVLLAEKLKVRIDPMFLGGLAAKMPRPKQNGI